MNWDRIIANAGLTFCTSLIGFTAVGSPDALAGALFTAAITAGIAGFTEMKNECEQPPKTRTQAIKCKIQKAIASGLVF